MSILWKFSKGRVHHTRLIWKDLIGSFLEKLWRLFLMNRTMLQTIQIWRSMRRWLECPHHRLYRNSRSGFGFLSLHLLGLAVKMPQERRRVSSGLGWTKNAAQRPWENISWGLWRGSLGTFVRWGMFQDPLRRNDDEDPGWRSPLWDLWELGMIECISMGRFLPNFFVFF